MKAIHVFWPLLCTALIWCVSPSGALAADDYNDFAITSIDTAPTSTCVQSDGCAKVEGRSISIENTGSATIYCRPDVDAGPGLGWDTSGEAGIAAGETIYITSFSEPFRKVWCKTASGSSSATVRRVK
jgi:hypothetical protein